MEIIKQISDKLNVPEKTVAEILLQGVYMGTNTHTTREFKEDLKQDLINIIYNK